MGVRGKDNAKCWEVDGKYAPGRQVDRSLGRYHFGVAIQSQKVTRVRDIITIDINVRVTIARDDRHAVAN